MGDFRHIDAARQHWYREEHFARQFGTPSARAVIEGRWQLFAREIRKWLAAYGGVSSQANPGRQVSVLDAGCGDGINLIGLTKIFSDLGRSISLSGIDYNDVRIERAKGLRLDCTLTVGSLDQTGLADGAIDFVLLNHVLEHIPGKIPVLTELRRVLLPGGLLIVGVPNEGCTLAKLRNHVLQRSILRTTDHVHFFTAATLRRDLEATGFVVERIAGEGFFVPHLRIATTIGASASGRRVLTALQKAMPSQAAGLIAIARARSEADQG